MDLGVDLAEFVVSARHRLRVFAPEAVGAICLDESYGPLGFLRLGIFEESGQPHRFTFWACGRNPHFGGGKHPSLT